jgi:hypothetical protein
MDTNSGGFDVVLTAKREDRRDRPRAANGTLFQTGLASFEWAPILLDDSAEPPTLPASEGPKRPSMLKLTRPNRKDTIACLNAGLPFVAGCTWK